MLISWSFITFKQSQEPGHSLCLYFGSMRTDKPLYLCISSQATARGIQLAWHNHDTHNAMHRLSKYLTTKVMMSMKSHFLFGLFYHFLRPLFVTWLIIFSLSFLVMAFGFMINSTSFSSLILVCGLMTITCVCVCVCLCC
jgi:hypothetical protein